MMIGRWPFIVLLALAANAVGGGALAADGSAEKGKIAYVKHGCWQCHGFAAQGGIAGPKLAPDPMPLVALTSFVRNTRGAMPLYQDAILSNADLADIHAWLASLPKENNCQGSTEKAQPVGVAVDKKQPEFLEWAQAVEKSIHPQLVASEQKVIETMK